MLDRLSTWPRRILLRPWLLAFVPINAATSGFGVLLPLYILLRLHGSLLDIAFAAVLFNVSVILASILWGHLCDRTPDRRLFLLVNFGGFAVAYAIVGLVPLLPVLFILYTIVGLLAPAGSNASNLLILEQFGEAERPAAFASFQEMSILGAIAGVLVGFAWLAAGGSLTPLLYLFAALAAVSLLAVWVGTPRSAVPAPIAHLAHHPASFVSRIRHSVGLRAVVPFFPHLPRWPAHPLPRFRRWVSDELRHELPLILGAGFLFNFASNLFNTSYTPYLASIGLASAAIFLVNCSNNVAQALSFPASGGLASREGSSRLVHQATYLRSLGYLAVAGFTFVSVGASLGFQFNLVAFALLGLAIALYSTASSLLLFRGLRGREAGSVLGLNSALGGVAAVLGSVFSGVLSYFGSYRLTFLVAAAALLASMPVWTAAEVAYERRRGTPVAATTGPALDRPAAPDAPPATVAAPVERPTTAARPARFE